MRTGRLFTETKLPNQSSSENKDNKDSKEIKEIKMDDKILSIYSSISIGKGLDKLDWVPLDEKMFYCYDPSDISKSAKLIQQSHEGIVVKDNYDEKKGSAGKIEAVFIYYIQPVHEEKKESKLEHKTHLIDEDEIVSPSQIHILVCTSTTRRIIRHDPQKCRGEVIMRFFSPLQHTHFALSTTLGHLFSLYSTLNGECALEAIELADPKAITVPTFIHHPRDKLKMYLAGNFIIFCDTSRYNYAGCLSVLQFSSVVSNYLKENNELKSTINKLCRNGLTFLVGACTGANNEAVIAIQKTYHSPSRDLIFYRITKNAKLIAVSKTSDEAIIKHFESISFVFPGYIFIKTKASSSCEYLFDLMSGESVAVSKEIKFNDKRDPYAIKNNCFIEYKLNWIPQFNLVIKDMLQDVANFPSVIASTVLDYFQGYIEWPDWSDRISFCKKQLDDVYMKLMQQKKWEDMSILEEFNATVKIESDHAVADLAADFIKRYKIQPGHFFGLFYRHSLFNLFTEFKKIKSYHEHGRLNLTGNSE